MKIKMNWGTGIVITTIVFMGYILVLVRLCMKNDIELVDKHYYKQEIEYQDQMDKIKNGRLPESQISWHYDAQAKIIQLSMNQKNAFGKILFMRPSNGKLDKAIVLETDKNGKQLISSAWMNKGMWRVKVNWSDGHQDYFKEETLVIQ
jgi:hypothetical protein